METESTKLLRKHLTVLLAGKALFTTTQRLVK